MRFVILVLLACLGSATWVPAAEPTKYYLIDGKVEARVAATEKRVVELEARIAELERQLARATVPGIVAPVLVDAGHHCPTCGREERVVYRGTGANHSHKCQACGTEWWHAKPTVQPVPVQDALLTLPAGVSGSGGCVGGNCPAPALNRPVLFPRLRGAR